jgi:beta-lactamase regulating signal transducer with metallopeptidase domain
MDFLLVFFSSYIGMYIVQTCLHCLIAVLIVATAAYIWEIDMPGIKQVFFYIPIIFSPMFYIVYQIINPTRGSISFRAHSLFDVNSWLFYKIYNFYPLMILFLMLIFISIVLFIFQEILPIIYYKVKCLFAGASSDCYLVIFDFPVLLDILKEYPFKEYNIQVVDDIDIILFSTTGKRDIIYISKAVVEQLNNEELKSVIAHEVAHIGRNKKYILILVYFFRILQFYNPMVLLGFRRIIDIEEMLCDDLAVSLTDNRKALADALYKLFIKDSEINNNMTSGENYKILRRIDRLNNNKEQVDKRYKGKLIFIVITIFVINYFIV